MTYASCQCIGISTPSPSTLLCQNNKNRTLAEISRGHKNSDTGGDIRRYQNIRISGYQEISGGRRSSCNSKSGIGGNQFDWSHHTGHTAGHSAGRLPRPRSCYTVKRLWEYRLSSTSYSSSSWASLRPAGTEQSEQSGCRGSLRNSVWPVRVRSGSEH